METDETDDACVYTQIALQVRFLIDVISCACINCLAFISSVVLNTFAVKATAIITEPMSAGSKRGILKLINVRGGLQHRYDGLARRCSFIRCKQSKQKQ